jgi:2-iminobutanoate/2-iminopropanoate deaminase
VPATIFVPSVSSPAKIERIRNCGAQLVVTGASYADALAESQRWSATRDVMSTHAFDQLETILGQGTLGLELENQAPRAEPVLAVGPFSPAVRDGNVLYLSGQAGQDPATGRLVEGGVGAQAARALENIRAILDAAGRSLDDVMRVGIFLVDMNDFATVNETYAKFFSAPFPARTTVAVAALPLGALVEIEVIATANGA